MHVRSDILLLVDEFEDFQNMCLEIYELDSTRFLTAPGLAWEAVLQKNKVRLDHLTEIDMLLMVKKVSEEEYSTLFIYMRKLIINTSKIMIKLKNLEYWDVNNLYGWLSHKSCS